MGIILVNKVGGGNSNWLEFSLNSWQMLIVVVYYIAIYHYYSLFVPRDYNYCWYHIGSIGVLVADIYYNQSMFNASSSTLSRGSNI